MKLLITPCLLLSSLVLVSSPEASLAQPTASTAPRQPAWTPGAMAPPIQAVSPDGSPVVPERGAIFPAGLVNMHVLVVFWSLRDAGDVGLVSSLKELRRTFGKGRFQIVSVCIDDAWDEWIRFIDSHGTTPYAGRDVRFSDDPVWWQLTQAGSGVDCAANFRATKTPTAFLIQPNGRFFAVNIPSGKLRAIVAKALDWAGQ
jgi:hypothetical protein